MPLARPATIVGKSAFSRTRVRQVIHAQRLPSHSPLKRRQRRSEPLVGGIPSPPRRSVGPPHSIPTSHVPDRGRPRHSNDIRRRKTHRPLRRQQVRTVHPLTTRTHRHPTASPGSCRSTGGASGSAVACKYLGPGVNKSKRGSACRRPPRRRGRLLRGRFGPGPGHNGQARRLKGLARCWRCVQRSNQSAAHSCAPAERHEQAGQLPRRNRYSIATSSCGSRSEGDPAELSLVDRLTAGQRARVRSADAQAKPAAQGADGLEGHWTWPGASGHCARGQHRWRQSRNEGGLEGRRVTSRGAPSQRAQVRQQVHPVKGMHAPGLGRAGSLGLGLLRLACSFRRYGRRVPRCFSCTNSIGGMTEDPVERLKPCWCRLELGGGLAVAARVRVICVIPEFVLECVCVRHSKPESRAVSCGRCARPSLLGRVPRKALVSALALQLLWPHAVEPA